LPLSAKICPLLEEIIMFKKIVILLTTLTLFFYAMHSFAMVSPGAGQAQIRNNMQEMQQNKTRMKQNEPMIQKSRKKHHKYKHNDSVDEFYN
jgi:hypothetical protein